MIVGRIKNELWILIQFSKPAHIGWLYFLDENIKMMIFISVLYVKGSPKDIGISGIYW